MSLSQSESVVEKVLKVLKYQYCNIELLQVKVRSGVEVKVLEIGNIQVKYKYLKIVLKYSTVNVLSYFTPLLNTVCCGVLSSCTTCIWMVDSGAK